MQDCITSCENAYTKRQEAKDAAIESANDYLQSEFIAAWLTDPQAKIKTPGFDKTEMTLAASAFIKSCAQRHAAFHEGDL